MPKLYINLRSWGVVGTYTLKINSLRWLIRYIVYGKHPPLDSRTTRTARYILPHSVAAKEASNIQTFQKEILQELRNLRETLLQESHTGHQASSALADDLKDKKIAELEAENKRLAYRITHLTRNLRAALDKQWWGYYIIGPIIKSVNARFQSARIC